MADKRLSVEFEDDLDILYTPSLFHQSLDPIHDWLDVDLARENADILNGNIEIVPDEPFPAKIKLKGNSKDIYDNSFDSSDSGDSDSNIQRSNSPHGDNRSNRKNFLKVKSDNRKDIPTTTSIYTNTQSVLSLECQLTNWSVHVAKEIANGDVLPISGVKVSKEQPENSLEKYLSNLM
ncbi:uncharacterized protein LOC119685565 [Teleopsis dalmanni]|uniref:uncharacterized protein LOC119685565 n=1 Tax=Teleopsis dalmanni TaxID=139649 RepID=UPI000D32BE1F|nr:uncharacterized protein LOC119685565 [Teleopsis dalmanni]